MSGELDAFLTFSGIVSAIIAVFVSQSAIFLQPDTAQLTVDILRTISQQLANPNTTAVGNIPHKFQSATIDIVLNSLLNAGLFCSLIASAMGLWVKQWLREYVLDEPTLPRSRARVRAYRYHGLRAWGMRTIVACIFTLLQLSVLLFFAGVVMLAFKLNTTLAWFLLVLTVSWEIVTWGSALCSTFFATTPFKSPLSRAIFHAAYQTRHTLYNLNRFAFDNGSTIGAFSTIRKNPPR